jgi:RNA polymerase sigma-70 factor, ECF subfamily
MSAEESCDANVPELPGARGEAPEGVCSADGLLVERLRQGDANAGYRFFREYYPSVYRYLFWLTHCPDQAEDLAQETFVRAWRHLDRFDSRGNLRAWLHRIAHREFLRSLRHETPTQLSVVGEVAAPEATVFTEAVALRELLRKLPAEQREVVLLHDLEGYSSAEIAAIVGVPARTVYRRLEQAREHLRQELGEDDLTYLNEPLAPMRQWAWLPLHQMYALETRLARGGEAKEDPMERREFLRQAAVGAAGLALSEPGKEVVDGRLTQKVTLAFKGEALSDLCERLRTESGVHVSAGPSVADEKVTLFCKQMPLRDVMRQLSRPFGYTWLRSTRNGQYRYELVQDLRSQLLEEELRNRNRHAALLALEEEIQKLRPYLHLTPEEIMARAKMAAPNEKQLLEQLGGLGWGTIQMYFRLTPQELAALRAGEVLYFSEGPREGERLLPPDVVRGILHSWRSVRAIPMANGFLGNGYGLTDPNNPNGVPISSVPGLRASCTVALDQLELGQYSLHGWCSFFGPSGHPCSDGSGPYVVGRRPELLQPESAKSRIRSTVDPALRLRISLHPGPSCFLEPASGGEVGSAQEPRVTSADVLEVLHQATGLPIVADYYTRLCKPETVSVSHQPISEGLDHICDAMRMRWHWELREGASGAGWLQFRSIGYYDDRLKEVPNRLLTRWTAVRRQHGFLPLEELVEIGQLTDAQLGSTDVAEGAKACNGLAEWDIARESSVLRNLHFLAGFTPEQRQEAMSPAGLPFIKMPRAQQQAYLARVFAREVWGTEQLESLEDLAGAVVRIDYSQPGWYEWQPPGPYWLRWVVPYAKGPEGKRAFHARVRERTREAALAALRQVDPEIREAVWQAAVRANPRLEGTAPPPDEEQIMPTRLDLATIYMPDTANKYHILFYMTRSSDWPRTW